MSSDLPQGSQGSATVFNFKTVLAMLVRFLTSYNFAGHFNHPKLKLSLPAFRTIQFSGEGICNVIYLFDLQTAASFWDMRFHIQCLLSAVDSGPRPTPSLLRAWRASCPTATVCQPTSFLDKPSLRLPTQHFVTGFGVCQPISRVVLWC